MGEHEAPKGWFGKFLDGIEGREVVVVRGLITLVVVVGASWGADFTDVGTRLENTLDAVAVFVSLLGLGWIRSGVAPYKEVVVQERGPVLVAGPASGLATGSTIGDLQTFPAGAAEREYDL